MQTIDEALTGVLANAYHFNNGEKAMLKKNFGRTYAKVRDNRAKITFISSLNERPAENMKEPLFFALTLFCKQDGISGENFQNILAGMYKNPPSASMKNRIESLFCINKNDKGHLYRDISDLCSMMIRNGKTINIIALAKDLFFWNDETKNKWINAMVTKNKDAEKLKEED